MAQSVDTLLDSPVFRTYLFYATVLVVKMMFMSMFTGFTRFARGVSIQLDEHSLQVTLLRNFIIQ